MICRWGTNQTARRRASRAICPSRLAGSHGLCSCSAQVGNEDAAGGRRDPAAVFGDHTGPRWRSQVGIACGFAAATLFGLTTALMGLPLRAQSPSDRPQGPETVTFTRDVAPILFENCGSCHRPGGPGPFSVFSYGDVGARAARIAEYTARRLMPPWLPNSAYREFANARRLEAEEIATLQAWADAGAPEGNPADLPALPDFSSEWPLGQPDLVLEAPAYTPPASGLDVYRNLVVPAPLDQVRYVSAVDLQIADSGRVHHATLMVDTTGSSREMDMADPEPGFDGMERVSLARSPSGRFVGWTPGRLPQGGHADLAWALAPGSDLVVQLHVRPTATSAAVKPRIGLYFASDAPSRPSAVIMLEHLMIDIPPGEDRYLVRDSVTLPVAVEVVSLQPHAHYLGKEMEGIARLPDGRTEYLIRIDDWDFDWQDEYRLATPLRLPAGTVLMMSYAYDNSPGNPQNPTDPPVQVRYGPSSTDEMADLIIQVICETAADREVLDRVLSRKCARARIEAEAWREHVAGREAAEAGDLKKALAHFQASLRARESPQVMVSMVDVVLWLNDSTGAMLIAERAAQITGYRDATVLDWLAKAYAAGGDTRRAVEILRHAVELARQAGDRALATRLEQRLAKLNAGRQDRATDRGKQRPGAQVYIPGLGVGTLSRDLGRYILPGVPAGSMRCGPS